MIVHLVDSTNSLSVLLLCFSHDRPRRSSWNSPLLILATGSRMSFNSCKHNTTGAKGNTHTNTDTHEREREPMLTSFLTNRLATVSECDDVVVKKPPRYCLEMWVLTYCGGTHPCCTCSHSWKLALSSGEKTKCADTFIGMPLSAPEYTVLLN